MSYAELLGIIDVTTHDYEVIREFNNSHGVAPVIWDYFVRTWLPPKDGSGEYSYLSRTKELWPLHKDTHIPLYQRRVLRFTYDLAIVKIANYAQFADDIRLWLIDCPPKDDFVNHWEAIAAEFEAAPKYPRIGLYGMSVGENLFDGAFDEVKDKYLGVTDAETFDIFSLP